MQGLKALNNSVFWRLLKGQVYETEKKSRHTHWISYLGASLYRSYQSSTPQGSFSIFFFFFNISGHWLTFGEGNGTPLQYSCLENPMDGGAWKAAVHGVTEGRTRLRDFTFTFHFHALEKEMATHSSVLAWRVPGTEEPGGLPSMGSHRVGYNWSDLAAADLLLNPSLRKVQDFKRIAKVFDKCFGECIQAWRACSSYNRFPFTL